MNKVASLYKAVILLSHATVLLVDPYVVLYCKGVIDIDRISMMQVYEFYARASFCDAPTF